MRAHDSRNREAFYSAEIEVAKRPLSAVRPAGACSFQAGQARYRTYARKIAAVAPTHDDVRVLGPAEAPLAVVRAGIVSGC